MATVTALTRRGQVTIPREIRDRLGLKPFDAIEVSVVDGEIRLSKTPSLTGGAGALPVTGTPAEDVPASTKQRAPRDGYEAPSEFRGSSEGRARRPRTDLDAFYQRVPALNPPRGINEMTEIAAEEHAQEAARAGLPNDDTRVP